MLTKENPLIFELNGNGEYIGIENRAKPLDRGAIGSIVEIARNISHDYEYGFKETVDPDNCKECGFMLYCDGTNM
jgi:DNA helicase-2/ATP-dependent DNA helicase PcrA